MLSAVLPDDYETSIRVIMYKGDRDNWHQWKIKMRAIGMKKRWIKALDANYSCKCISTLLADDKLLKKKNNNAWYYLVMACDGEPFDIITSETESNAFRGWEQLKEEYEHTTEEALISMQEKCVTCKMVMNNEDPALWINTLKVINKRLGGINKKYEKGDIKMISYVMANLPKAEYSEVVTVMKQNGIANKTIIDLRLAVRDKWERSL
jgi:hypothetical protein